MRRVPAAVPPRATACETPRFSCLSLRARLDAHALSDTRAHLALLSQEAATLLTRLSQGMPHSLATELSRHMPSLPDAARGTGRTRARPCFHGSGGVVDVLRLHRGGLAIRTS